MHTKFCVTLFALIAVAVMSQPATAGSDPHEILLDDAVTVTAEVIGIDRVDRTLMLLGPEGEIVEVEVGYEARNFGQIEIGDQLTVSYHESVAIFIDRHGNKPETVTGLVTARSPAGDMPAGIVVETVDVSAVVHAINRSTRMVPLALQDGSKVKVHVDDSLKIYNELRERDLVHVRYTEAIAISVD